MTINLADNSPRISYAVAQGATQTSFAVPFEFFASADLNVYVDGTLKTLTTHYTVSGGDGSTGTVTISVTGATGGSTVVITRDVALERTTDFPSSGPFQIGALNTELDRLTAIAADLDDKAGRALQLTDFDVAASLVLPTVDNRKGKTLAFNASSGAVEAGPTISDVQTVSAAAADIQTLAHIEDGTDATDAIQTVAGIASNVSTVAGVSSAVSTVAGISSNVTAVAADATDIGVVAGKAAEIGRLGTAQAVADLDILATTDAVSDMNTLAAISANISTVASISANVTSVAGVSSLITSDFVADLNTLATTDIVSDLNTLATADIVSDLNTLATSDIVSDLNTLATADIVSDLNTLATTDIVSDLNTLATTDIVTDLNLLATSAIVEDLNLLATSTVIADMATLAGAGANPNISSLGVSGTVTAGGLTVDTNTLHVDATNNRVGIGTSSPSSTLAVETGGIASLSSYAGHIVVGPSTRTSSSGDYSGGILFDQANGVQVSGKKGASIVGFQDGSDVNSMGLTFNVHGTDGSANREEAMRITSAGNVGIGTSSPVNVSGVPDLTVAGKFFTSDGTETNPAHSFTGDQNTGIFRPAADTFAITTGGSEAMRIDSSGNLLVGKTSSNSDVVGVEAAQDGHVYVTVNNTLPLYINRQSGDELLRFASNGATVGSIRSRAGVVSTLILDPRTSVGTGVGITGSSQNAILPTDAGGNLEDAAIDFGDGSTRYKDLYLSGTAYVDTAIEIHAGNSLKLQNVAGNGFATIQNAGAGTNTDLGFSTAGSERMRIDSSGNLLVGETSAVNNGDITLARSATDANISLLSRSTTDSQGCAIQMQKSSTNSGNFAATADGENLGAIVFRGVNTSAVSKEGAQITVIQDGTNASTVPAAMKFATGGTERMRIISQGALQVSDTGSYRTWSSNITGNQFIRGDAGQVVLTADATSTGYTNDVMRSLCNRSSSSSYEFFTGTSGNLGDDEFRLRGDGNAYADGSWNGGGADYAEYFEWADGNAADEDRVGLTVVLNGNQIRKATSSDDASSIIGAVSANPSVVGDTDIGAWKHKYLRDDFGRYIRDTHNVVEWTETVSEEDGQEREIKHSYEDWNIPADVTVPEDATTSAQDQNGNPFDHKRPNPDYDPDRSYISREDRPEWATIGMMGKLRIRKGQPTGSNWIKMRDVSDTVEEWLVR